MVGDKCGRSACINSVQSTHFVIYNDQSSGHEYCVRCGRGIIQANPDIRYDKVVGDDVFPHNEKRNSLCEAYHG